jgi:8-oxo-dGTP diphosphatase
MPRKSSLNKQKDRSPIATVDIIVRDGEGRILMERRGNDPFKNYLSLPGGHVESGETVEHAASRELFEECAVKADLRAILGVYSDPKRDPRGPTISTVFVADGKSGSPKAGDDAQWADWMKLEDITRSKLAFDHANIIADYSDWVKENEKGTYWSSKKKKRIE